MLTTLLALICMAKTIEVPFIEGLEKMTPAQLHTVMDSDAAQSHIDQVNWPDDFPYKPDTQVSVARSDKYLAVSYQVEGRDLRATEMEDGGRTEIGTEITLYLNEDSKEFLSVELIDQMI